jgi:hypothetical protein
MKYLLDFIFVTRMMELLKFLGRQVTGTMEPFKFLEKVR